MTDRFFILINALSKKVLTVLILLLSCVDAISQSHDPIILLSSQGVSVSWYDDATDVYIKSQVENVLKTQHQSLWSDVFDSNGKTLFDALYVITDMSAFKDMLNLEDGSYILFFSPYPNSEDSYILTSYRHGATQGCPIITDVNGKRLYFTGRGEGFYAGDGVTKEGLFQIEGHEGETTDIYISNLTLSTAEKTLSVSINEMMSGHLKGMACPFAITTDGEENGYVVHFHINGSNQISGGTQTKIEPKDGGTIGKILASILEIAAPPIAIRPMIDESEGIDAYAAKRGTISFDDKWPTDVSNDASIVRTNGELDLRVEGRLGAPSIDLGNSTGSCSFDGGRYILHTPRTNSMFYVSSMSICYRMLELMGARIFGMGSSVSSGNSSENGTQNFNDVVIYDGTFSVHPALEYKDSIDVVANGWYKDYSDLRLPYNTKIDGGTFNNCNVYVCDASAEPGMAPANTEGKRLCKVETIVEASDIDPIKGVKISPVADYGSESLTPVEKEGINYIYLYLPDQDCEGKDMSYIHNWVTVIPLMGVSGLLTMGGNQTVYDKTLDGKPQENAYLLYTRLNEYTKEYAGISVAGFNPKIHQAISLAGDKEYSGITNTGDYEIANGLYMMLSFKSNEWNTIVAPYDIANIYVLETTETQKQDSETLEAFLERQGEADGNLAQTIVTSLCPDIFSGKGSGVHMSLTDICRKQLKIEPYKLNPYNPALDGHHANQAHFYLYEQVFRKLDDDPDAQRDLEEWLYVPNGQGEWDFTSDASQLSKNWQCVTPQIMPAGTYVNQDMESNTEEVEVWMKKGRIYSLFLPSDENNYWDGKYLIFEGYGPQIVTGRENYVHALPSDSYKDDQIITQGNLTFHNDTLDGSEQIFLPERRNNGTIVNYDFVRTDGSSENIVLPGQVYAVLSPDNTSNFAVITRQGQGMMPHHRQDDVITADDHPHVGDKMLTVYSDRGTLEIYSYAEQRISVLTIDGRQLWDGQMHDGQVQKLTLPAGIYLVQGDYNTIKVIVK